MTEKKENSTIELLAITLCLTVCLVGFSVRWSRVTWVDGSPWVFVPLLLATFYAASRWSGFDILPLLEKRFGKTKLRLFVLAAMCVVLLAVMEPLALFVIPLFALIAWWFYRQFARAEEITEAQRVERRKSREGK